MATKTVVGHKEPAGSMMRSGTGYDWIMCFIGAWLMIGGYSDGWAHNHLPVDNFFTPWHGAFYSGFLVAGVFLVGPLLWNHRKGIAWANAMPRGYELSLLGAMIIFVGGIGDMFWHILFGIEKNVDGLFSPTHIAVIIGLALVISGPYRAAWKRKEAYGETTLRDLLPMLLSLTFLLSTMTIVSQLYHPFVHVAAASNSDAAQELGAVSIVVQTVILVALLLVTLQRWQLPFGSLTLVLTINTIFLSFMQDTYFLIPVVAFAGLLLDVLMWRLRPGKVRPIALRLFAFAVPVVIFLLYFLAIEVRLGVAWTVHLWLGTTFVSGVIAFALSYLVVPPAFE